MSVDLPENGMPQRIQTAAFMMYLIIDDMAVNHSYRDAKHH